MDNTQQAPLSQGREFMDGNTAIARGAMAAGCDFFAGYPITPATPILLAMMRDLPDAGGIAIQGEDEIASIGFCIGAAMSGRRVFTATSGPGISLYSENIGLAIMGEVPMVIVDVQRMGPATGGATTVAQGDVQFVRWSTSGGYPMIVLCPTCAADCYTLTVRAFDLAEQFRCPVFILTDKEIASTMDTVEVDQLVTAPVRERVMAQASLSNPLPEEDGACTFVPCDYPSPEQNMPMSPYGGPHLLRFTTSTHDEHGYLTKNPAKVERLNRHLMQKINACRQELELVRADLDPEARTLMISYGVSARAMEEAVRVARDEGEHVSALTLLSLWPLPECILAEAMQGVDRVVVAELNEGQMRREVERLAGESVLLAPARQERCLGGKRLVVVGVNRIDGELITPEQILAEVDMIGKETPTLAPSDVLYCRGE